jgi:hypothetical protein
MLLELLGLEVGDDGPVALQRFAPGKMKLLKLRGLIFGCRYKNECRM